MSRAFVKEDYDPVPVIQYDLPDPRSETFAAASASALIQGANLGETKSAEIATGYSWGDPRLNHHIDHLLTRAQKDGDDRTIQLAKRFLKKSHT
ncbi:MAG: hypothetical protein OSA24_03305 [Longimicrobiales bacterium]|nr:hypothetical protein [Longimicrobiales bacterium]